MSMIKICGLFRDCDIDYVNEALPDFAGFILHFPKSHRSLEPDRASELKKRLRPEIKAVCVFVDQPVEYIREAAGLIRPDVIQLHGSEDDSDIAAVKNAVRLPVWKAFKIRSASDLAAAQASTADEILLDNGYGTGAAFDWSVISSGNFPRPFILAGGLTPERILEAARLPGVKILDISSGVETGKKKDHEKILAAVYAAHDHSRSSHT